MDAMFLEGEMELKEEEDAHCAAMWWQMRLQALFIMEAAVAKGGSMKGKSGNIQRKHHATHVRFIEKYFWPSSSLNLSTGANGPAHPESTFERRFRLPRVVFNALFRGALTSEYFTKGLKPDACGRLGIAPLVKVIAALRELSYGLCADLMDDLSEVSSTTARDCLVNFCTCTVEKFGPKYLRAPTAEDLMRIEKKFRALGFPGCIGAVDCAGWVWKNCPKALQGSLKGKGAKPERRGDAICDMDLWIWHWQFGFPGVYNYLQILDNSDHFANVLSGSFPSVAPSYNISGQVFNFFYYLADGIYPTWQIFLKTLSAASSSKDKYFAKCQESVRKVVERVFSVQFRRFQILESPSELMDPETMALITRTCVIMNNMIVEVRRENYSSDGGRGLSRHYDVEKDETDLQLLPLPEEDHTARQEQTVPVLDSIKDKSEHQSLTKAVIEYLWARKGSSSVDEED